MGLLSLRRFVVGQSIGYFFGGSPISVRVSTEPIFPFIVDLRINEALQTGAVGNRTYRCHSAVGNRTYRCHSAVGNRTYRCHSAVGNRTYRGESIYLFLEFTILEINSRFNIAKNSVPVISHYRTGKLIGYLHRVNGYNGYSQ